MFVLTSDTEPPFLESPRCMQISLAETSWWASLERTKKAHLAVVTLRYLWQWEIPKINGGLRLQKSSNYIHNIYRAMFDDTGGQRAFEFVKIDSDWPHDYEDWKTLHGPNAGQSPASEQRKGGKHIKYEHILAFQSWVQDEKNPEIPATFLGFWWSLSWVISHVPMFHITQPWSVLMVY